MINMSYMLFTALVMLLWITNLSVSNDVISTGYAALWSNMIPKQNVWLLIRMQSHLLPFQQLFALSTHLIWPPLSLPQHSCSHRASSSLSIIKV